MSTTAEFFRSLAGLALLEELRWRMRDDQKLYALLGIDKDTLAIWRLRGNVPDKQRAAILSEIEARLTTEERERDTINDRLGRIEQLLRPTEAKPRGRG